VIAGTDIRSLDSASILTISGDGLGHWPGLRAKLRLLK